jgi:hypothetical protein
LAGEANAVRDGDNGGKVALPPESFTVVKIT